MRALLLLLLSAWTGFAATPAHPRLFLPDSAIPTLKQRIASDSLAKTLHDHAIEKANHVLTEPTVRYEIPDGLRLLAQSREGIARILHTAYAWRMTGDRRYFDRCVKELDAASALQDWNPKHFLDVAEMGTAVSIGYDWLYSDLTPEQRHRYEDAIATKSLETIKTKAKGWWTAPTNNWSQVCSGGLMIAADALAEARPDLTPPILEKSRKLSKECERFYLPDGAYPEGPAYWHYGTTYEVLAMALEERDGPVKLEPLWQQTSRFLIHATGPSGMPFNYSDAPPGPAETSSAQTWIAARTADPLSIQAVRDLLTRRYAEKKTPSDRFLPLTLLWLPAAKASPQPELTASYLGEQSLAFFRSDWTADALWLGIKGGTPAASHAHMDVGSFVLDWAGSRWFHDLGSDDYNLPGYFGAQRFTYFRLQNLSHNTLSIGGQLQNPKAKPCPVSPIVTRDGVTTTQVNLDSAYEGQCKEVRRTVSFDAARHQIEFADHLVSATGPVRWQAVTDAKVSVAGNTATLEKGGHRLVLTCPTGSLTWKVADATAPTEKEKSNPGKRILSLEAPRADDITLIVRVQAQ